MEGRTGRTLLVVGVVLGVGFAAGYLARDLDSGGRTDAGGVDGKALEAEVERLRAEIARRDATALASSPGASTGASTGSAESGPAAPGGGSAGDGRDGVDGSVAASPKGDAAVPPGTARFTTAALAPALKGIDWTELGRSMKDAIPLTVEVARSQAAGEKLPPEAYGRLQTAKGPLATLVLALDKAVPATSANARLTHPVVASNAIAATLEAAGLPLDGTQSAAVETLTAEHAAEDERRLAAYTEDVWMLRRLLDETAQRRRYYEAVRALLTPEQRDTLNPPAIRDRTATDLFSAALIWARRTSNTSVADRTVLVTGLADFLVKRLQLPVDRTDDARATAERWFDSVPLALKTDPVDDLAKAGFWPLDRVQANAEQFLRFLESARDDLSPGEAGMEVLRNASTTVVLVP